MAVTSVAKYNGSYFRRQVQWQLLAKGVVLRALCVLVFCFIIVNVSGDDRAVIETCYEK